MAKRRKKLSRLAALASAVQLMQLPDATVSFTPAAGKFQSIRIAQSSRQGVLVCQRFVGSARPHSCTAAAARSARREVSEGPPPRLRSSAAPWGWRPQKASRPRSSPRGSSRVNRSGSSSALAAFWTRNSDPVDAEGGGDETRRGGNSLWRRILPSRGGGGGGGGSRNAGSSEPGSATGRTSSPALSKRRRTTGRSHASSNRSRTKSSSARYFYSVSHVNEYCPSFPNLEECPIDDSVYDMFEEPSPLDAKQQSSASRFIEDAVDGFIHRHAIHTLNLRVTSTNAAALSFPRVLFRGDVGSVQAAFDRVAFPALKLSGGGRISANNLNLNAASFVPALGRFFGRRFRRPFEFHAENCVLTQEDLVNSRCIRNGLANLGTRILKRVVMRDTSLDVVRIDRGAKVTVDKVEILKQNMLFCNGIITTILGTVIPFEVQTGLHVSSVSGHVLHFPGLEVTFNPRSPLMVKMPLHVLLPVDLDIGDNALVENVEIDGRRKQVKISMRATVTPARSKRRTATEEKEGVVGYRKKDQSRTARYSCDIGQWLTNLGRF